MSEVTALVSISELRIEAGEQYDSEDQVVRAHPEFFTEPAPGPDEPPAGPGPVAEDVPEPEGEQPE